MPAAVFEEMKQYVAFDHRDAANLRALGRIVERHLPAVAERFYQAVQGHPATRRVLAGDAGRGQTLRGVLLTWLRGLFCGVYDAEYARQRAQIGRTHVRVGLPQHFMIVAMEMVWQELGQLIRSQPATGKNAKLASLHKLLTIETGLMLESYRGSQIAEVRQVERDAMQARLREAEQLAQIGQLAASLAHEIKNPLAGISGAIQVIRASLKESDPHWPVLGEVLRQISRLDRSVKDLLVYARPKPPQYQRCDLRRAMERVLTLLRKEPEFERVRFEHRIPAGVPPIAADEHQLEQLLMNLLLNAAQASPPGGVVRLLTAAQDGRVRVVVEDRGCGMTLEVARRALEPFFTTKARGTGLGLPICQKIVEAHGGTLSIHSVPGEGTEVTVELMPHPPAAPASEGLERPTSAPVAEIGDEHLRPDRRG
jgi:signal transduction histidine kinase